MGIGDWGLGIGDWGLGPIPNPQNKILHHLYLKIFLNILLILDNIFLKYCYFKYLDLYSFH
jgi:hypothetical protein